MITSSRFIVNKCPIDAEIFIFQILHWFSLFKDGPGNYEIPAVYLPFPNRTIVSTIL